jgi:peptide-N4-(N-acetyl-beta-glucosaminyl)asparagine amidase
VTWRYSNKHQELLNRRKLCSEKELITVIIELRRKRQIGVSPARKKFLLLRTFAELGELLIIREPSEHELKGRSSGSLSWRLERGETNVSNFYVFNPSDQEQSAKQFNVRYSCAKDVYERLISASGAIKVFESIKEWKSCLYLSENVFRKIEHDHKMAYLSRNEDSTTGMIQWKFDFSDMTIKTIDLKLDTKTFHSGVIVTEFLDSSDSVLSSKEQLIGASRFSIRIKLSGGNGDCAWQHAQVFRESLNSQNFPFHLSINFN